MWNATFLTRGPRTATRHPNTGWVYLSNLDSSLAREMLVVEHCHVHEH